MYKYEKINIKLTKLSMPNYSNRKGTFINRNKN